MSYGRIVAAAVGLAVVWCGADVRAQNLWQRRSATQGFLFYDTQARQVGDLLTIVVREDSSIQNTDNRGMKKQTGLKSAFSFAGAADGGFATQESAASASEEAKARSPASSSRSSKSRCASGEAQKRRRPSRDCSTAMRDSATG